MQVRNSTDNLKWNKIKLIFLPIGSRRRIVVNIFVQVMTHPRQIMHYIKPQKIKRVFYYLFHDGVRGLNRVLEDRMLMGSDLKLDLVIRKPIQGGSVEDYPALNFELFGQPKVSIIIPVYNQFDYTYSCLRSILENTEQVTYEIIIADDCSDDMTRHIQEIVNNINVIKTPVQSYFLKNCNFASTYAKGEYLLFLNNDTQVQKNWLKPMCDLMDKHETVGMTGSCLVFPDGRMQEAGGILWKDGSAWNYGNGYNPAMPEYRYIKEVDYISGASIMIRKSIWEQLGGFDERYVPAYCEDSDLAFSVRKAGYKVIYQPLSIVVHFEGVSNGTDVNSGIKAYQVKNQKKFYEKWKGTLEKEHLSNAQDVFRARDRGQLKKSILVIDHRVPWYDRDAGARNVYMYTKFFAKLGMKVTFLPDNFYPYQPYTQELEQSGVEVLYGNYYLEHWREWLAENLHYFDYIYANRPEVTVKYIDLIKKYATGKLIYFGHDLHYLREQRQYEIEKDEALLKSAEKWKELEFRLLAAADVAYVVGSYEQEVLQKEFPDKPIRSIPIYTYKPLTEDDTPTLIGRSNLLFVGGFNHLPNIDAVLWFTKEIFPEIMRAYPDIVLNVVGSNPPEEIQKLNGEHIKILGFVSDEKLHQLYRESRLAVVPLRYGAGVKGKVVECIYNQCPFITTPVGAEGLDMDKDEFVIAEPNKIMAKKIIELYENDQRLIEIMGACVPFINNHFTEKQAMEVIKKDIDI